MNKDYTHIVIISDRSGSMGGQNQKEYENSINCFVDEQKKQDGRCTITFCEFDDKINFVHEFSDVQSVKEYKLVPRGMTALYQAIGETFQKVGKKLSDMNESDRPGLVSVVICTDGLENASNKIQWPLNKIANQIKTQRDEYNWSITFIGADIDAEAYARDFGIAENTAVSFSKENAEEMYASLGGKVANARKMTSRGCSASATMDSMIYTDDEKSEINN